MGDTQILPGTGRWRREAVTEGAIREGLACGPPPPPLRGPPPRAGEDFSQAASRLAGQAGVAFGWTPEVFWRATPAELGALVRAVAGEDVAPPGQDEIARMMEAFPDG